MKLALLLLIPFAIAAICNGQQTVNLRVTGQLQSDSVSKLNFYKLHKGYRGADWTVSVDPPVPVTVSLEWLRQKIQPKIPSGVSILSRASSMKAIQDASARSPVNKLVALSTGTGQALGACEGVHVCGTGGGWTYALMGAYGLGLFIQYIAPNLPNHTLQSATEMLPETISLNAQNLYTQPGMIIVELAKHTPEPPALDEAIQVTIPK